MADICQFTKKTAASKRRVGEMAKGAIAYLHKADEENAQKQEQERTRQMLLDTVEFDIRRLWALYGEQWARYAVEAIQSKIKLSETR